MRYSPGDPFHILVPGLPDFSGEYAVNADGRVILPFAGELKAVGLTNAELNQRIEEAFVESKILTRPPRAWPCVRCNMRRSTYWCREPYSLPAG